MEAKKIQNEDLLNALKLYYNKVIYLIMFVLYNVIKTTLISYEKGKLPNSLLDDTWTTPTLSKNKT